MTMFTRLAPLVAGLSMRSTIITAWKNKLTGWFYVGLLFVAGFATLFWILPRFLPRKKTRLKRYMKISMGVLALGLLLLLYSLVAGIGFGFGLGGGKGKTGVGSGDGDTNKKQQTYKTEGELDIAIIGTEVYIDEEPVAIDKVRDQVKKKNSDSLTVVLIDAYSDYGTYKRVEAILNELMTAGQYEKRKEN